jgi:predicted transcriptional regulator
MTTEAFTVRADTETVKRLDELAAQMDRSRNYLVNQAIKEYLELHAWQLGKIEAGIAAAERGELVLHDEVFNELRASLEKRVREP